MSSILERRHYLWCFSGFLLFAIYGSLVPFRFTPIPWSDAIERFTAIPFLEIGIEHRSDFVANILLFIPLGFCGLATFVVDRPNFDRSVAWGLTVVAMLCGLSVAIEFTQIFFPPRTVSQNDILAETVGGLIGVLIWIFFGERLTQGCRRLWNAWDQDNLVTALLPGYLLFLVIIHVMPLDITISPVELWHKYKEARLVLIPFSSGGLGDMGHKAFLQFIYYAPLGILLGFLPGRYREWFGSGGRVLVSGLAAAGFNEFLQVFVFTRSAETTDVITGTASVVAGWVIARRLERSGWMSRPPGALKWLVLAAWIVLAAAVEWQPFDFNWDAAQLEAQIAAVNPIPFADYYVGTDYNSFDQFLHKTLLFFPLGVLLVLAWRMNLVTILVLAALAGTFLEVGQLALPGRFCSISDVVVLTFGAAAGSILTRRIVSLRGSQVLIRGGSRVGPAGRAFR